MHEPKKTFYRKFLYEPFPVESSLQEQLHDHINAEIVNGTIRSKQDGVDFLTWSYFFRRLGRNPAYYQHGTEVDGSMEGMNRVLSSLIETTVNDLEYAGCVEVGEDGVSLTPLTLGKVASYYYLSYTTVPPPQLSARAPQPALAPCAPQHSQIALSSYQCPS